VRVAVTLLEAPAEGLPREQAARLGEVAGIRVGGFDDLERELERADVVLDCIFGTGFRGKPEGDFCEAIELVNDMGVPVLSADIPSGVDGATGAVAGVAVQAAVTLTFGAAKPGALLFPGAGFAGLVEVVDIGFPGDLVSSRLWEVEASDVASLLPQRPLDTTKREAGNVLVVGGSATMTGAVCLAAQSAYRAGAGLVTVAVPESILPVVQGTLVEAVFVALPEEDGGIAPAAMDVLRDGLDDYGAISVGPGMGRSEAAAVFARALVAAAPRGLVVDADALNAFAGALGGFDDRGRADIVLTPHIGEFARLTGRDTDDIRADRVAAVRELSSQIGANVLLKGSSTLIGEPSGEVRINTTGSSALATGGTGDVLSGAIAALIARGMESFDAATAASFVHGIAGSLAALEFGDGVTAGDVCAMLPLAFEEAE
jgi:NAD(P)H-hydrate epimerase